MEDKLNEQQYRDSAFPRWGKVDISGGDFPLPHPAPILIFGDAGAVTVVGEDDVEETSSDLPTGYIFPGRVKTVKQTGTTATKILYLKLK